MCGRYSLSTAPEAMRRLFQLEGPLLNLEPRYNVAPTQMVPVIRPRRDGGNELTMMRWGLVPAWSKTGPGKGPLMINARAETVADQPAFRSAFRERRCLVPADGFYEWKKVGREKWPFRFTMSDGAPFVMAGLWETWREPGGGNLMSFTIIVTGANALVAAVHDRMPVILDGTSAATWLGGGPRETLHGLLAPFSAAQMTATPVSQRVNSAANDDPGLIEPLAG
ncbi:MAG: SOS response-associated peptidase [Rhodospirillaceae bacterium]|nr:SOS response-associated peptidase [Rhodospirillaceae bacterium]